MRYVVAVFAPRRPQKPLRKQKDPIAGNSLIYVIAHYLVVRRMGNAILKNPNPVDSALFCWLVLSAIWTNGPKAVTSRRSAYVSGSPVRLCVYESF